MFSNLTDNYLWDFVREIDLLILFKDSLTWYTLDLTESFTKNLDSLVVNVVLAEGGTVINTWYYKSLVEARSLYSQTFHLYSSFCLVTFYFFYNLGYDNTR